MTTVRNAIERLQKAEFRRFPQSRPLTVLELLEIVYGPGSEAASCWKRRADLDNAIARANIEAGYVPTADFFGDVWPRALAARNLYNRGIFTEAEMRAEHDRIRAELGLPAEPGE